MSYSRNRIIEKWKIFAPHLYWGPRFDVRFYLISEILKHQEFNNILDIGCGPGIILSELRIKQKVGVDISKEAIQIAGKVDKRIMLLLGDMMRLPFKNEAFDAVIAANIIEIPNLKKRRNLTHEIYRVLRNHGILFLTTPNGQHRRYINASKVSYNELKKLLKRFLFKICGYNPLPTQKIFWRISQFERILFLLIRLSLFRSQSLFFYVRATKKY